MKKWIKKLLLKETAAQEDTAEQQEYIAYAQAVEATLRLLESHLHESDDSAEIIQNVMKTACEFYQGDWVGFLEVDLELGLWTPYVWYNIEKDDQTTALLQEFESAEYFQRWVEAMESNQAVCIENPEDLLDASPEELKLYRHVEIKTLLAVPVKPRPTGFLVIRNPQRYITRSSLLQMLAFVLLASINEQKLMRSLKMSLSPESIKNDTDIIINLFGNLEIYTSSGVLREGDLKSPKCCRLLAYMLLNKKVSIASGEIAEAIWPDEAMDSENPGKNIRALIFRLRQAFALVSPYPLIETTSTGYRLNPKFRIMTDLQQFDKYWTTAQQTASTAARVEILKQAVDLYKGKVLASAESEPWIMLTESHYELRYIGIINELLQTLEDAKDYQGLHKYAAQSLAVVPGNVKAHYWLILATCRLGAKEMANTQMEMARKVLTDGEYYDLTQALKAARITALSDLFHNWKRPI